MERWKAIIFEMHLYIKLQRGIGLKQSKDLDPIVFRMRNKKGIVE